MKKSASSRWPLSSSSAVTSPRLGIALDAGHHGVDDLDALRLAGEEPADQRLVEMVGMVERPERDQRAVGLLRIGRLLLLQQRAEQMHVVHRPAGGDGIDIEIVGRRARAAP